MKLRGGGAGGVREDLRDNTTHLDVWYVFLVNGWTSQRNGHQKSGIERGVGVSPVSKDVSPQKCLGSLTSIKKKTKIIIETDKARNAIKQHSQKPRQGKVGRTGHVGPQEQEKKKMSIVDFFGPAASFSTRIFFSLGPLTQVNVSASPIG